MELQETIKNRHSCRTYLPTPISDETIKKIVESARLAPSAKNSQPWKFVCIKTATESHDISKIMEDYYIKNKDNPDVQASSTCYATAKILQDCPAIILVFENSDYIDNNSVRDISALLSIGGAVEHMMLTATELGLGALWIGDTFYVHNELLDYILDKLKKTQYARFIDENNRLICAMALGQSAEPSREKPRKSIEEILCIINN